MYEAVSMLFQSKLVLEPLFPRVAQRDNLK